MINLEKENIDLRNKVKKLSLYRKGVLDKFCKLGALEEIELLEELIEEKKVDKITNDKYNITIEVIALSNLKKHIKKRKILRGRDY